MIPSISARNRSRRVFFPLFCHANPANVCCFATLVSTKSALIQYRREPRFPQHRRRRLVQSFPSGAGARDGSVRAGPEDRQSVGPVAITAVQGGGRRSFMDTATIAAEAGVADLSDAALVKRFAKAADWLGRLVCEAIGWNEQQRLPGLCVDVVDATTVGRRGAKGTDHRLHLRIDLASNRVVEAELTDAKGGETLDRFAIRAGGVVIADAGYAHRGPLGSIAERGGHFIVRFGWSNFPLENEAGEPLDLLATLESLPEAEPAGLGVFFRAPQGSRIAARLVAIRKSEPAAASARQRLRQQRSKERRSLDLRTLQFAGFTFLGFHGLPPSTRPARCAASRCRSTGAAGAVARSGGSRGPRPGTRRWRRREASVFLCTRP